MFRLLIILVLSAMALACGNSSPPREWNFTLIEMGAWENSRQWDLFDDQPELYATFRMGPDAWRSSIRTRGSWTRSQLDESFSFTSSSNLLIVEVLDDDFGSDDDLLYDDDPMEEETSFLQSLIFGAVNDADDRVLKASVEIPDGAGILQLRNEQGYLLLEYSNRP